MAKDEKKSKIKKVVDKQKATRFQKGHTVNKDRPQYNREERFARTLDRAMLFRLLNLNINKTAKELREIADNHEAPYLERMIAKCMLQGFENRSLSNLDYFLTRIVGKVPDEMIIEEKNPFKDMTLEEMKAKHAELAKSNRETLNHILKDKKNSDGSGTGDAGF